MILKRKIFALFRDMDDDGDYDYEDAKLQYKDWVKSRKGYPMAASIIGSLGTAGAAYGGSKLAENRATKKSAKEIMSKTKQAALKNLKAQIGKKTSDGKVIKAEQVKKVFENAAKGKKKALDLVKKAGGFEKINKEVTDKLAKNMKGIKTKGAIIAGALPLVGTVALAAREADKNEDLKYGPKRIEVGQVRLVQKKKKKKK